jgi:hypothetical protein
VGIDKITLYQFTLNLLLNKKYLSVADIGITLCPSSTHLSTIAGYKQRFEPSEELIQRQSMT